MRRLTAPRKLVLVLLIAVIPACGIRVPHEEVERAAGVGSFEQGQTQLGDGGSASGAAGEAAEGQIPGEAGPVSGAGSPGNATVPPGGAQGSGATSGGGTASGTGSGGKQTSNEPANGPPIILGNIGTYSGAIGSSLASGQEMAKIWAAWVNRRGGINGHPVKMYTADDGGDPSKTRALAQQMVEDRKVVAFVGSVVVLTVKSLADYVDKVKVPAVGGDLAAPDWNEHPMLFAQGTASIHTWQSTASLARGFVEQAGGRNWGTLICAEGCDAPFQKVGIEEHARKQGFNPVYNAQASLTQPSYTSQCLDASSRGVHFLFVVLDASSIARLARDCAAQDFRPVYLGGSTEINDSLAKDPNLEGMLGGVATFPWTFGGTPAAKEYLDAVAAFNPKLSLGSVTSVVWTSGKLLEAALASVSPTAPVTSADVAKGLYSLKNETLGGLAPPLNFVPGKPSPIVKCYFGIRRQKQGWVGLNAGKAYC